MEIQWENLPEECWELVFDRLGHNRHLEAPSLVCKRFLSISNLLRSSLTVSDPTVLLHGSTLGLLRRFHQLKRIDLVEFHGDSDRLLREVALSGLNLEVLNLSKQKRLPVQGMKELGAKVKTLRVLICSRLCFLQDSDLVAIADSFPSLEELDISNPEQDFGSFSELDYADDYAVSGSFPGSISDSGIANLSSKLQRLCRINVSGNHFISDRSLFSLSSNCAFLEEIMARDCSLISEIGIALAIHHNPQLISLSVNGSKISSAAATSSSSLTMESSFICARALGTLDFSLMIISDDLLNSIIQADLPLRRFGLSRCRGFTFAGISSLLCKYSSLNYLDIEGTAFLTDQSMSELSHHLHDVNIINLNSISNLTNSTFFLLVQTCPHLEEIRMENTSLGKEDGPSDLKKNSKLQTLKLSWNKCLTDETLKGISMVCPSVRSLDISHCWSTTGEGIGYIGMNCCEIKMLELSGCSSISNLGTSFGFSKLEVLHAAGSRFDDEGLRMMGHSSRWLLHLDLEGCLGVTAKGLKEVVTNCKGLKEVSLKKCCNVGSDVIAWMVFSRPSLRNLIPPCDIVSTEKQKDFFLRHGCWVHDC
ncbi:SCF E3 ubiquitin ligase complex F-box protein pof2-like [Macadamia integrifolia]|uniref:SCF E3 ubiquitin ligase complex F-box protein pof2-like n=1 Tax=Macadamia integrifolia TaxID=60698 RepID=UPI001C4EA70A|nr:SCF E3 ubiquitin ligase complex F-box protein pof2-like [Macadamia integrifolia]